MRGWSGGAKVSCILCHRGVQLVLAYSWAWPAILVAGKGREVIFSFLLFLHFHSCSSFFPVPLFHLFCYLLSLFSLSLGDDTKWPIRVDVLLNPNTINQLMTPCTILTEQWTTEVLIRLLRIAGCPTPLVFANGERHVFLPSNLNWQPLNINRLTNWSKGGLNWALTIQVHLCYVNSCFGSKCVRILILRLSDLNWLNMGFLTR